MSRGWVFKSGDWNFTCDSCGQKLKASKGHRRWDGFMVCKECFEMRHPQDFLKARSDKISVPWSRPQLPVLFDDVIGWTDVVKVSDAGFITIVFASEYFTDQIPVNEYFVISRNIGFTEQVLTSDLFQTIFVAANEINESVTASDDPDNLICNLDYVDPTYFAAIYVGTCVPLI